jgi:hypothetical protein
MSSAEIIAIAGAVVSFGSVVAAMWSAGSARKNAKIARQAALLAPRSEAIDHLHNAVEAIKIGTGRKHPQGKEHR